MMSPTQFLDLPNELLLFVFQYIKSSDLIQAFLEIQSSRIQRLIRSFLHHLDVSQKNLPWIEIYLPILFLDQTITALRLQDQHLALFCNDFPFVDLQSMHILSSDWTTDLLKEGIECFRQRLKQLSITFTYPHGKGDIANHLFQSDSSLEYLSINGRFLYFDQYDIQICFQLTHLEIELEGIYRVFILMTYLPQLQTLKVKLQNEDRMVQLPTSFINGQSSTHSLKHVTFTGSTKYFDHIENFCNIFGSTIEYFSLNLDLIYYIIDGNRLQRELLDQMPQLSSLDLILHSTATYSDALNIQTFRNPLWEKYNPIVYCYDLHAHEHTIFTLPYKSDRFKSLTNDCVVSCVSNRLVSLCFEHVQTVSLIPITPLNLKTFEFIQGHFPNIQTLELTNPIRISGFENEHSRILHDNLLSNLHLQLPSITKFSFLLRSSLDDYQIFRRLIHLLPNLIDLQMYFGRILFREIFLHEHIDMRNALMKIKILRMVRFYDEKDKLTNEEIHRLFPNAQILFDYNEL